MASTSALGEGDSQGWAFSGAFPGGPVVKTPHFKAGGAGLLPGQETKIPHAVQHGQKNFFKKAGHFLG